jgi:transcriptional regulator with XRE-family HTH domain
MASRPRGLIKSLHSKEQLAFRELLIETRRQAGLTQYELAELLKRPQSFIAKYEGGERRLDVVEFIAIARAMNSDPIRIIRALIKQFKQ